MLGRVSLAMLVVCLLAGHANAQSMRLDRVSASDLCQRAITNDASTARLPPNLLGAIGRVESGRLDTHDGSIKAWPWSINAEGRGYAFNTKSEAMAAVRALQARNVASIDVGCMQVNLLYHPSAFTSLDDAFDPIANVRYAAKFLGVLFAETKDWNLAAAFYHSKTPDRALSYQRKVLAQLPDAPHMQVPSTEQISLTNAWTATLNAHQLPSAGQSFAAQGTTQPNRRFRSFPMLLASRR